ncbi:helix-turn-helix transcriptional regulator [Nocardioides rubriscoriae]|uniref:helix-turn-helix transcriptional regulator n=1 Tax=Nocardioides rubriscoriae TaxID=642762 RepID=UPI001FEC5020|nr:response regulator transcription factor [Nocardioides rubriscoriae]
MNTSPLTVAVVSPIPAVEHGLTGMLAGHHDIEVVDLRVPGPGSTRRDPDVVLYDTHALTLGDGADLDRWLAVTTSVVVALRHDLRPALGAEAVARGAHASVDVTIDRAGLVRAVVDAARDGRESRATRVVPLRLGHHVGLTPREVDVLSQITQGLSNQEIAEQSYLSINSVKTYIRSAYRRIGVTSRAQAVVWCVQNGFPSAIAA